jgi:hypothetical protein
MSNDQKAQQERARRLREEISRTVGEQKKSESATPLSQETESPREFVHRRMQELDRKQQRDQH